MIGGIIAAMFAVAGDSASATIVAVGLALASIEIWLMTTVAGGFTPIVIPVLVVNSVLLSAVFLWEVVQREARYGITFQVPDEYQIQAAVIGIVFSVAYTVGALLAGPRSVPISLERLADSIAQVGAAVRVPTGVLVGIGYGGIILAVYAWQGALLEGRYLIAEGPYWAVIISSAIAPLAILALCIVAARPGPWRLVAIVGVCLWSLILFSRATRVIAALPALIVLSRAIASGQRVRTRTIVVAAIATVLLLQLVLVGRGNREGVGLIPLGTQLFTRTDELLSGFGLNAILGNIWISGPLTAVVSHRPIPPEALWISLNPMPGALVGWDDIKDSLRLNVYTPYNALGELSSHGWLALVLVAGATGFVMSLSTRIASNLRGAYQVTAMMMVLVIVALFSVTVLQYNLRSTFRLVWYTLFGVAAIWLAQGIFSRQPQTRDLEDPKASRPVHNSASLD